MVEKLKLNINKYLQKCNSKDVISFNSEKWISVGKLKEIIYKSFYEYETNYIADRISNKCELRNSDIWFHEGEECELLKAGSDGWQKGKIKINVTLEFIPDEYEKEKSPLDDVRQELDSIT